MKKLKKIIKLFGIMLLIGGIAFSIKGWIKIQETKKIQAMSFEETIIYNLKDKPHNHITIGTIENGKVSIVTYKEGGKIPQYENSYYEIGSLTKIMTAALYADLVSKNLLTIENPLPLDNGKDGPRYLDLITHTSGAKSYYFATPMIQNFLTGSNPFHLISESTVRQQANKVNWNSGTNPFSYSNYGYALLGSHLAKLTGQQPTELINNYLKKLKMTKSGILKNSQTINPNFWEWHQSDGYQLAGAVISTPEDMMKYLHYLLYSNESSLTESQKMLKKIKQSDEELMNRGIIVDGICYAWMVDNHNGYLWHNGATGSQNAYFAFSRKNQKGIFVLSDQPFDYRASATWIGSKWIQEHSN